MNKNMAQSKATENVNFRSFEKGCDYLTSIPLKDLTLCHLNRAEALIALFVTLVNDPRSLKVFPGVIGYKTRQLFFSGGIGTLSTAAGELKRDMRGRYFIDGSEINSPALRRLWGRFTVFGDIASEGTFKLDISTIYCTGVYQGKSALPRMVVPLNREEIDPTSSVSLIEDRLESVLSGSRSGLSIKDQVELSLLVVTSSMARHMVKPYRKIRVEEFDSIELKLYNPFYSEREKKTMFEARTAGRLNRLSYSWHNMSMGRSKLVFGNHDLSQISVGPKTTEKISRLNPLEDASVEARTKFNEEKLLVIYRIHVDHGMFKML